MNYHLVAFAFRFRRGIFGVLYVGFAPLLVVLIRRGMMPAIDTYAPEVGTTVNWCHASVRVLVERFP